MHLPSQHHGIPSLNDISDKHFALEPSCTHAGVSPLFSNVKQYFVFRDSDQKIIYFARFVTDHFAGGGGGTKSQLLEHQTRSNQTAIPDRETRIKDSKVPVCRYVTRSR